MSLPDNPLFYFFRYRIYQEQNENTKALEDLDNAIRLISDIAFFYYERGEFYNSARQYDKAIDDYTTAIQLKNDKTQNLLSSFANSLHIIGFDKSMPDFTSSYNKSEYYFARGRAYKYKGQIELAIKDFNESLILDPDSIADYFLNPGFNSLYERVNNLSGAISFYNKIIALYPKKDKFYVQRAYFLKKMKQHEKALKDYSRAIELDPQNSYNYSLRGDLYQELKRHDKAIKDYTQAIVLTPDNPFPYLDRARSYIEINQQWKARGDLQKACDLQENRCYDLFLFEKEEAKLQKDKMRGANWVLFGNTENASHYYDKTESQTAGQSTY